MSDHICTICEDTGWVCENHPKVAWAGITGKKECCGGAGEPCVCNTANPPWAYLSGVQPNDDVLN